MQTWLGALFVVAGLLAVWQNYQVVQYALSLKNRNRVRREGLPQQDHHWCRSQVLETIWWTLGGVSSIGFGTWLLIFAGR